jgi:hypothetical protein
LVEFAGFAVDDEEPPNTLVKAWSFGLIEDLHLGLGTDANMECGYVTAAGNNKFRSEVSDTRGEPSSPEFFAEDSELPHALVGHGVKIREGSRLAHGAIFTTRAAIGRHCILNVHSSVSHDCVVGHHVNINPGTPYVGISVSEKDAKSAPER